MHNSSPWQGRYVTLDGMRGIAALAVALFHYNISQAPHGYLAVDFFFALSGFVLCRTYLPRWEAGLPTWAFMKQRMIRLYPLFLVGLVVTTLSAISNRYTGKGDIFEFGTIFGSLPFNLLMLPSPITMTMFPMNVPAWSLFFELVANFLLVLVLFRLPKLGLLVLCLAAGWRYGAAVLDNDGGNLGAVWDQFGISAVRTTFAFAAGVLIARLPQSRTRPRGWTGLACLAAIAAMLLLDLRSVPAGKYDLVCSMLIAPALVWVGARCEPPRLVAPAAWFLGEVSYALYAVHWALMEPLRYFKDDLGFDQVLMAFVYLGSCLALAWLCVRGIDVPTRAWLSAAMRGKPRPHSVMALMSRAEVNPAAVAKEVAGG